MKDQINTIREALVLGIKAINHLGGAREAMPLHDAMPALTQLEAMVGEPWLDERGYTLTPLHTAAPVAQQYEAGDMASAAAQGFRDGMASVAQPLLNEAIDRINDMLKDDDGQAYKEARKFVDRVAQQPQARPDFTDEWTGYLKDGETPFERFLRERKDLQSLLKLYQRVLEENERLKGQQPQADEATAAGLEASINILSQLVDEQRQLLAEVDAVFGVDEHGIVFEDGDSALIDRVRAHLAATNEAQPPQAEAAPSNCTQCSNADSWGTPDKPVCLSCKAGSKWEPLNKSSVNPNKQPQAECRSDGRCQYAIDSGAEGLGHCPKGKCVMQQSHAKTAEVFRCKTCGCTMQMPHDDCLACERGAPQQAEAVPTVQIVNCKTCKHSGKSCDDYPCRNCGVEFGDGPFNRWEAPQQAEAVPSSALNPDESDSVTLWAEIWRLREAVKGPDGYATWQDAATAERIRRVRAENKQAAPVAQQYEAGDMAAAAAQGFRDGVASVAQQPTKMPIPPGGADPFDVVYAEGWNAACDAFFGGKPAPEPVVITIEREVAQQPHECTRSHPHENMDGFCVLRTEIARLTNENARVKALLRQASLHVASNIAVASGDSKAEDLYDAIKGELQ